MTNYLYISIYNSNVGLHQFYLVVSIPRKNILSNGLGGKRERNNFFEFYSSLFRYHISDRKLSLQYK